MQLTTNVSKTSKLCMMFIILMMLVVCLRSTLVQTTNDDVGNYIAFADVGDSYEIYAYVEPADANQEVEWELIWDQEHTSEGEYNRIKDYPPTNNVGMLVEGNKCTIWCIKYHTVVWVKQTVYLTLTARSVENNEVCATCLIKLG